MKTIVIEVCGRPSPWANEPHETAWREAIADQAKKIVSSPLNESVRPSRMIIEFKMIQSRRGDLDNLAKPVMDTLFRQKRKSKHPVASIFCCDDFYLAELTLKRLDVMSLAEEGALITIEF